MSERPTLITIIGVLEIVLGVLAAIGAIVIFVTGTIDIHNAGLDTKTIEDIEKLISDTGMSWSTMCNVTGALILVFAIIDIVIGYGFLQGWRIFWWIGLVLNALSFIGGLVAIVVMIFGMPIGIIPVIIGLAINGVIIWYLLRPNVKEFFGVD